MSELQQLGDDAEAERAFDLANAADEYYKAQLIALVKRLKLVQLVETYERHNAHYLRDVPAYYLAQRIKLDRKQPRTGFTSWLANPPRGTFRKPPIARATPAEDGVLYVENLTGDNRRLVLIRRNDLHARAQARWILECSVEHRSLKIPIR